MSSLILTKEPEPEYNIAFTLDELEDVNNIVMEFMKKPCCGYHHEAALINLNRLVNAEIHLRIMQERYEG